MIKYIYYGIAKGRACASYNCGREVTVQDKKQVVLKAPIKTAGRYPVNVKMYAEVAVSVTVVVD